MNKLLSLLLLGLAGTVGVHAAGTDELWEMTSSMEMPGMKMPATKSTFCLAKGGAYTPESPKDSNCKILDMKTTGNTMRWKMVCTGTNAMEGIGEMSRTADTMTQKTTMTMGTDTMSTSSISKRIGSCDAAGDRKKMEDKVAGDLSKMCAQQVDANYKNGGYEAKMPKSWTASQPCASAKPVLCEKARAYVANGAYDEYTGYSKSKGWVAAECGINLESRRVELCKKAVTEKQNPFIKEHCPVEAKAYADEFAKNCQGFGRDYTADLARPNAKQCTALRFWGGKSVKGAAAGNSAAAALKTAPDAAPAKTSKAAAPEADKPAANKADSPGAAIMDGVKSLKDKFKF